MNHTFLVFFSASHINCENRYGMLKSMIESVVPQTYKIPLFISISYAPDYSHHVDDLCKKYKHSNLIKIYPQSSKLSQFSHYAFLCSQIPKVFLNKTWILFCDDDDYNHPLRSWHYQQLLSSKDLSQYRVSRHVDDV